MTDNFIEIGALTLGAIYRLRARNIVFGVYLGEGRFAGIRNKFGNRFLDVEHEWTTSTHYGTARAVEQVGALDPVVPLKTELGTECEKCKRPAVFIKGATAGNWGHEDGTELCMVQEDGEERRAWPYSVSNKVMFEALDRYDKEREAGHGN